MSQRRNQRRARQVRRSNVRAAQRRANPPTPAQIAARLLREVREPLASRDPLDAELVASQLMSPGWEQLLLAHPDQQTDMPHPALPIVALLRNLDPATDTEGLADAALALAHALAAADREDPQLMAAVGVLIEQLRLAGVSGPAWASEVGRYELVAATDIRDVWMSQHQLVLTFRDSAGHEHGLMALIDRSAGMQLAALEVIEDPSGIVAEMRDAIAGREEEPLFRVEQLDAIRAGGLLWAAVEGTFDAAGELLSEHGGLELLQLLLARYELLEADAKASSDAAQETPFDTELDGTAERDISRDELAARFGASQWRRAIADVDDDTVGLVLDWVFAHAFPRALFGPDQAAELLLGTAPKLLVGAPDRISPLMTATRAWARFAAELVGLDDAAVEDVLGAIEHYGAQLRDALSGHS